MMVLRPSLAAMAFTASRRFPISASEALWGVPPTSAGRLRASGPFRGIVEQLGVEPAMQASRESFAGELRSHRFIHFIRVARENRAPAPQRARGFTKPSSIREVA